MNLDKFGKALKRELKRSPKKSAILGVMCLVALYFWVPLLSGWFRPKSDNDETEPAVASASATPVAIAPPPRAAEASAAPSSARSTIRRTPWSTVVALIDEDPQMKTGELPDGLADPFRSEAELLAEKESVQQQVLATTEVNPQDLGLSLSGTLISKNSRLATINRRSYLLWESVRVKPKNDGTAAAGDTTWEFRIVEIQANQVTLERNGSQYVLKLKTSSLGDGDRISSL